MVSRDQVIGIISLQNIEQEHAYSEADVRLLQTRANSMSVALENARLFKETEDRNAELAIINAVQGALAAELPVGRQLRTQLGILDAGLQMLPRHALADLELIGPAQVRAGREGALVVALDAALDVLVARVDGR